MRPGLSITAAWERLEVGAPEERACFAAIGIRCFDRWLTEGVDGLVNRVRVEPLLSAFHLAEWLTWNWWRLRWEPRSKAADWGFAHRMATIGAGYVWPNVTIFSDGERTALMANPTVPRETTLFRYLSEFAAIVPSRDFESAVDQFVTQVMGQLQAERVSPTNLERLWHDVTAERHDPVQAQRRRLEALLGHDPDAADAAIIDQLVEDGRSLGESGVAELAADGGQSGSPLTAALLRSLAAANGYDTRPRDGVLLHAPSLPRPGDVPAWQLGAEAARALRHQEQLGAAPLTNRRLAEFAGTQESVLSDGGSDSRFSFTLDETPMHGHLVLRSKWPAGRRFDLARMLGDRVVASPGDPLHAATRAYTYRQKMQRSFAAELLSPFDAVDAMLDGDYSAEAQLDVAEHFGVSDMTIRTVLVNHRRLEREYLDEDLNAAG